MNIPKDISKKNSKRNLLSNLDDMDSDDDHTPIYNGGPVTSTFKRSQKLASDNSVLLDSLMQGRRYIGEYHAQLSLDKIQLTDLLEERMAQIKGLSEKEQRMDNQLDFMFENCKRLSRDNEVIVAEGKRMDVELGDLYSQLAMEESKFRSTKKNLEAEREKHISSNQAKWKQQHYLIKSKEKLVKQHESIWMMQDVVEFLKVDVQHLQKQVQAAEARKLVPLVTQHELAQAAAAEVKKQRGILDSCRRKDCTELRSQLAILNDRLQELVKQQRKQREEASDGRRHGGGGPLDRGSLLGPDDSISDLPTSTLPSPIGPISNLGSAPLLAHSRSVAASPACYSMDGCGSLRSHKDNLGGASIEATPKHFSSPTSLVPPGSIRRRSSNTVHLMMAVSPTSVGVQGLKKSLPKH